MSRKDPLRWMPVDIQELDNDEHLLALSDIAFRAFWNLVAKQWHQGSLPNGDCPATDRVLRDYSKATTTNWRRHRDEILSMFPLCEDGRRRNKRCNEERAIAINALRKQRQRTSPATMARWGSVTESVTESVTDTLRSPSRSAKNALQDRTVQDSTYIQRSVENNTKQEDGGAVARDKRNAVGDPTEQAGKSPPAPPTGTTTTFDQAAEIRKRLDAYQAGPDLTDPDPEDAEHAQKALEQVMAGMRPGGQVLFLRQLAQFPPLQICMAADEWLKLEELPRGDPRRFFLGIVRGSAKVRYIRYTDGVDRKREEKQQRERRKESAGTKAETVGRVWADTMHKASGDGIGKDVLRTLRAVRRTREDAGPTPTEEFDGV